MANKLSIIPVKDSSEMQSAQNSLLSPEKEIFIQNFNSYNFLCIPF